MLLLLLSDRLSEAWYGKLLADPWTYLDPDRNILEYPKLNTVAQKRKITSQGSRFALLPSQRVRLSLGRCIAY